MNPIERLAALRAVGYLSQLDDDTLADVAARARVRRYAARKRIVSELEFGADVYVMVSGEAEVFVQPRSGQRQVLGTIGPGAAFGEMASLTGELRSATVLALTPVEVLVIADRDFDLLRARRPEIAVALVRTLADRIGNAERTLQSLLSDPASEPSMAEHKTRQGSSTSLWRELVVKHQKELAFWTLAAFVATLILVRIAVYVSFAFNWAPRGVLRVAYMSGFGLVLASACAAFLTFRPGWRRAIGIAYGIGAALIFNELGVTLAFDIFYRDIHTPDPTLAFDVERLYRRTEPMRAIAIGLVVLIQAAYLRVFYVRAWFRLRTRMQRLLRTW
jgi:CRP-like cAMP-binding protein